MSALSTWSWLSRLASSASLWPRRPRAAACWYLCCWGRQLLKGVYEVYKKQEEEKEEEKEEHEELHLLPRVVYGLLEGGDPLEAGPVALRLELVHLRENYFYYSFYCFDKFAHQSYEGLTAPTFWLAWSRNR